MSTLAELVDDVRALIRLIVGTAPSPAAMDEARAAVARACEALAPFAAAAPPPRFGSGADAGRPAELMPYDALIGPLNPIAPPVVFHLQDGRAVGAVRFTAPYAGPPGCVHGGVIAAVFDQTFNVANIAAGVAALTASLHLSFRRPTPLDTDVVFEGWQERVDGQRIHTRGRLLHDGVATVDAEGVFVSVPIERIMQRGG